MRKTNLKISPEFRSQTIKAIAAIVFFISTYVLIFILALILTALCVIAGVLIIMTKPNLFTLVFGVGFASLGFLILIFLVKFVFKSHRVDHSHLYEIKRENEPKLFDMIADIVKEVGTDFPKKVYLSADVNAAVFYHSNFWSMFLPIRKNLQIGLGLVNTVSETELKAILSHEFGHFSQKTMKVGSYVYNVNQVIFNLVYDDESYNKLISKWASFGNTYTIFVRIAGKIIQGIQWILRGLYDIVNKTYLGLSREMEFYADEVAAHITGFEPLKSSLLRTAMAEYAFNSVLNFYDGKISDNLKSENLFDEQMAVMNFYAERYSILMVNGLPQVTLEELKKYNKSKLVIKNQWASHPNIEDRISRLESRKLQSDEVKNNPANNLFKNIAETQCLLTENIFSTIDYADGVVVMKLGDFKDLFIKEFLENSFSEVFNGYYDQKNPTYFEIEHYASKKTDVQLEGLFSNEKVDLVYLAITLQNDIDVLEKIAEKALSIKSFDYDGIKYKWNETEELLAKLRRELQEINEQIKQNDINIFSSLREVERLQNKDCQLEQLYADFFEIDKSFDAKFDLYNKLSNGLGFVNQTTPIDQINANFSYMKTPEENLKAEIKQLMNHNIYKNAITIEMKDLFENYLSNNWTYFDGKEYDNENLMRLYTALNNFGYTLSRGYFIAKKQLLTYLEELIKTTHNEPTTS